jgi:hypothetical protein
MKTAENLTVLPIALGFVGFLTGGTRASSAGAAVISTPTYANAAMERLMKKACAQFYVASVSRTMTFSG